MTCGHRNLIEINEDAFFRLDMWNGLLFCKCAILHFVCIRELESHIFLECGEFFPT